MKEAAIDVITPVLDGEALLERCVLSVQQSNYPAVTHTLVVDARCTDQSVVLGKKLAAKYANVRFILDEGKSAAAAINHGFGETSGEILTWLGHDNTWTGDTPWDVNDYLSSKPEIEFLSGAVVIVREDGLVERTRLPLPGLDFIDLYFSQYIPAQEGCFWRRRVHQNLSEAYSSAFDYDLWLRLFATGIICATTNKTLAVFEKRAGQLSSSQSRYAEEMNQARMELTASGASRWEQLDFLLRDHVCVKLLEKRKVAFSPRIDWMSGAAGEFYFYIHGPGEMEIVSSQAETRLMTLSNQSGPVGAIKLKGTEGRFQFAAEKPGFYFVDLTARGKDEVGTCRLRCDEVLWNGESILKRDPFRAVSADCPIYKW